MVLFGCQPKLSDPSRSPPGYYHHLHKTTLLFTVLMHQLKVSFSSWLENVLIITHSLKWVDMLLRSEGIIYFESSAELGVKLCNIFPGWDSVNSRFTVV